MKINKITLSFPEKEEKLFLNDYYFKSIFQFRIAFVILIFMYSLFGFLDLLMLPEFARIFHTIRYLFVVPLLTVVFLLSFTKVFQKTWQELLLVCFVVGGTGISIMIMFVPENFVYYGGMMLVFSAGYFFIKLRFFLASIAGWTTLILFNSGAIFFAHIPKMILINYNFFFISANIIGMFAAYYIEYYARHNYFLNFELMNERLIVEEINKNLEKTVEERMKELLLAKDDAEFNNANVTAIIENTQDNIWAFNRNYEILYINQTFQKEFQQAFGVWLAPGVKIIEALPEVLRPIWKPRYDRVLNNEQFMVEDVIDTENGKIYIQTTLNPIVKNAEVVGGSCFGCNITYRKLEDLELQIAKEKVEESENNLRQLTENLEQVLWLTDWKTKKLLYVNPAYEKIYGMSVESAYENLTNWKKVIHPDDYDRISQLFAESAKDEKYVEAEYRIQAPDGTMKWVFDRSYPIRDADGVVYKFVSIAEDITKQKQAQKKVLEAERLSAIGELGSGVAHDFNNALQGILGNLELALFSDINPETRDFITTAIKSVQDATARVSQLQRFAKKNTIEQHEYESINLKDIIDDSIAQTRILWKDDAQKKGLTFNINTHYQEDVFVRGNSGELRSVLYNLIKNSIQAMPQGGTIDIGTRRDGDKAYMSIADTGIGMDDDTAKKIFQPFFTTKGYEQGKGLGMSAAYTVITEHKGSIYVKRSKPETGTEIEMMLPYFNPEIFADKITQEYSGIAKILWVDDEKAIRVIVEKMVSLMGHEIDVVSSGMEALELLANKKYNLMITDIGMPNMSGWQLTEKIKGKYPGMKVAVVTGWGVDVEPEQKAKYEVEYALGKPVDMKKIKNLISEVLQSKYNNED